MVDGIDPVRRYLEALRAYEAINDAANKTVRFIVSASHDISMNTAAFIQKSFGIATQVPKWALGKEIKHDMSAWPDAEKLRDLFTTWNAALTAVLEAWHKIPEVDRAGLKYPPSHLSAH